MKVNTISNELLIHALKLRAAARLSMRTCAVTSHTLFETGTSAFVNTRVLLVLRVVSTAVLLAHITLFSAAAYFVYTRYAVWTLCGLLLAMTMLATCSLLALLSPDGDTLLRRLLPTFAVPLYQTFGTASIVALVAFFAFESPPAGVSFASTYSTYALYAGTVAVFLVDVLISQNVQMRLVYVVLFWIYTAIYAAFVAAYNHVNEVDLLRDLFSNGAVSYAVVAALVVAVPFVVILISRLRLVGRSVRSRSCLPFCLGDNLDEQEETEAQHTKNKNSRDTNMHKADIEQADIDTWSITDSPGKGTDERSADHEDDAHGRSEESSSTGTDSGAHAQDRTGAGILDGLSRLSGIRSFYSVQAEGSRESTVSRMLSGRSSNSSTRMPRVNSSSSLSWSEVADVEVRVEDEYFRMPNSSQSIALPRVASVTRTSLT